jgi:hypothetical protein
MSNIGLYIKIGTYYYVKCKCEFFVVSISSIEISGDVKTLLNSIRVSALVEMSKLS